jgi:GAF domain-containing protein
METLGHAPLLLRDAKAWRALEAHRLVFERVALGAPLVEVLDLLTTLSETVMPDVLCTVLLLDAATGTLHHGAAPSLPAFYAEAIDGLAIGDGIGSCGTAAATSRRVIVEDIATHPYWTPFRELAARAGVRACWSEPIFDHASTVLGTFAMYYREPRAPDDLDLEFIETSAHVAGVAIVRARIEEELARHRQGLERLVRSRTAELEQVNQELRTALQDVKVLRGLLPICSSCRRVRDDEHDTWEQLEVYIRTRSEADFTHGICPTCMDDLYPGMRRG